MGNVCGCASSAKLQDSGVVAPRRSCSCKAVAPEYQDEVEKALAEARQELDAARQRVFEDTYQVGRIIGHGAFAKVQACSHLQSGQEFAAKTVQKIDDDLKQREGRLSVISSCIKQLLLDSRYVKQPYSNSMLAFCAEPALHAGFGNKACLKQAME
jgi:hypothetical protein